MNLSETTSESIEIHTSQYRSLSESAPDLEAVLAYLKRERGCDWTGYKRSTLLRRFRQRMRALQIETYSDYLQYLQQNPDEYSALLDEVLINFTGFFRDADAWDYLDGEIIPRVIAGKRPDEPIRIWSAGCATGEEIYSLSILFAEALGIEACCQRVRGYATDVDEAAISRAREGVYREREIAPIPEDMLAKYFTRSERGYVFHDRLRRAIVFDRHDLTRDAPLPRIDLLVCRNTLIYFRPEIQDSLFRGFYRSLNPSGYLFLGKSELFIDREPIFQPFALGHRVYRKGMAPEWEDRPTSIPPVTPEIDRTFPRDDFWRTAFESLPIAQLAIDRDGRLLDANPRAKRLFGLTSDDRGRPFSELAPGRLIASRMRWKTFYRLHRPSALRGIEWKTPRKTRYFDISIAPVFNASKQSIGVTVAFLDRAR
ncbi:CheR family methyltransferase [Pannus brasiliensis CCIBt3594]|uniref:protein-glutamate O-methyltransferase n=1 Tax=Pannus brasiliensis CCIBt3594 TaxID=1427578 RepID=A0AAW9QXU2_9CHRO